MLLAVFLVVILLVIGALALVYQLGPWQSAGKMSALDPELDKVPLALPDTSIATLPGERVDHFGISFQLPWKHTDDVTLRRNVLLASGEGGTVMFEDPSYAPWTAHLIREIAKDIPNLSPDVNKSICGLQRVAMEAKTNDVKWWKIPSQNKRAQNLLFLKVVTEPPMPGNGGLYAVNINGLCGFQRGNPQVAPYQVWVELFDSTDRQYKIEIISHGNRPMFRQAEVNAMIASIRPASPR
jgi:hypothetical protein